MCFSKVVRGQKVVEHTDDVTGSLPGVDCFVNEVVDLHVHVP